MKSNDLVLRINKITGDYEVIHKGFSWVSDGRAPYIIIRKKVGKKYLSTYRPLYSAAKKEFDIADGKLSQGSRATLRSAKSSASPLF